MIRTVLADSQKIVCEGIRLILEQDGGIQVVGCASTIEETIDLCLKHNPDVVLMDASMTAADGTDGIASVRQHAQSAKIILFSSQSDDAAILNAAGAGAVGCVLKDINSEELILTVKGVALGLNVLHREVFHRFTHRIGPPPAAKSALGRETEQKLTKREIEIIRLVTEGLENREIAKSLFISEGTVKNTLSGILKKLNLRTRIQLVVYAVRNNIGA